MDMMLARGLIRKLRQTIAEKGIWQGIPRFAAYARIILLLPTVSFFLPACNNSVASGRLRLTDGLLQIEEHPLLQPYCENAMEMRCFVPLEGTAEQILERHRFQRSRLAVPAGALPADRLDAELDGRRITAELKMAERDLEDGSRGSFVDVVVTIDDQIVFKMPLGRMGPAPNLHGLWVIGEDWYLEVAESTSGFGASRGIIVQNGKSLLDRLGYDEAFGFIRIEGKPFYFFSQGGKVNASFGGEEIPLVYDEVLHYQCCSGARNNPIKSEDMISYFARRGETWYYAEAGIFR